MSERVFITGGTGFIGRALLAQLVERGHEVTALVRAGSETKLPRGARAVIGDALEGGAWTREVPRGATFVQLVGAPSPSPWKAREFERVDLASVQIAVDAARDAECAHFVYLSVAQPAPVMKSYVRVRAQGERLVASAMPRATFVRPWYVLGPGRRWPLVLSPLYALLERIPATRASALRLGFVTLEQMTRALVASIERAPTDMVGVRVLDVPSLRTAATSPRATPN